MENDSTLAASCSSSIADDFGTGTTTATHSFSNDANSLQQDVELQDALTKWDWVNVDKAKLPYVKHGSGMTSEKFVSLHMKQIRLFSKICTLPAEILQRYVMTSQKMSLLEALTFNTVNATHCDHEFGYHVFTPNDDVVKLFDVVKLLDVENYYWAVKQFNISQMIDEYRSEFLLGSNLPAPLANHVNFLITNANHDLNNSFVVPSSAKPLVKKCGGKNLKKTVENCGKIGCNDLRAECVKRGLPSSGKKYELLKRLNPCKDVLVADLNEHFSSSSSTNASNARFYIGRNMEVIQTEEQPTGPDPFPYSNPFEQGPSIGEGNICDDNYLEELGNMLINFGANGTGANSANIGDVSFNSFT